MFEFNGGTYPGVWVYDGSGAQVIGVRLYLTPGVLSDPYPLSQVRLAGSTVGGIVNSNIAPVTPPPGTVWYNSGNQIQVGIPVGNFGYWNGTAWILVGTTSPSSNQIASNTAPPSPVTGAVWQNTSGAAAAGVPPGNFAFWNGTGWTVLGAATPQTGTGGAAAAGVISLNNLQGAISLVQGSGMNITQSGNSLTLTATGAAAGVPGVTSLNGATGGVQIQGAGGNTITTAAGIVTITAAPPASSGVASFASRTGAVVPASSDYPPGFIGAATPAAIDNAIASHLGAFDPHAQYTREVEVFGADFLAANAPPTGATAGQIWRNTSGAAVAGVAAGNFGILTPGATWFDAGSRAPFLVNNGSTPISTLSPGANNTFLQTISGTVQWATSVPGSINAKGFLSGLVAVRNAITPLAQIDFGLGVAWVTTMIENVAAFTKRLDAIWAAGSGSGGLFSGARAANTWYHCFIMQNNTTGVVDFGFDTSISGASCPAGWTPRLIWSIRTDVSSNIIPFVQVGDICTWLSPPVDLNNVANIPSANGQLFAMSTPLGLSCLAQFSVYANGSSQIYYLSSPLSDDLVVGLTGLGRYHLQSVIQPGVVIQILTNTASQIRIRAFSVTADIVSVSTAFYIHPRGR